MSIKNALRQFDSYRRDKMGGLETLLYKMLSNNKSLQKDLLAPEQVKRIIVIRNNKRIGNMYFMLPFLREVSRQYPDAQIDLLLNEPWQGQVFAHMGFGQMDYSHFSFKQLGKWLSCMGKLRRNQYDLVLVPYSSVGDAMMCAMLDAKNKVAEYNQRRLPAAPHSIPRGECLPHAALNSLDVLVQMGLPVDSQYDHTMAFGNDELIKGQSVADELKGDHPGVTMAYFRGARGDKLLSEAQWRDILAKFEQGAPQPIQWVEILSPDITSALESGRKTFQSSDMRHLAAVLKQLDAFICCDTGPLHLADAADATCIGIFTHTDTKRYGLLGANCAEVEGLDNLDAKAVFEKVGLNK
ncbi:glycosyltransferase family 9 protein [Vibrio sp. SCSIO 43136]|uniref:glycosyltransferase family 9 protein n=1 Tax=Vibrio sp. SCSIO 43136 TaxID=2819101 RepID=UPI0020752D19|nr:glycosyltransferase family 9 protein [Vibrio sp. SCSIO 43136]USD64788.1 glycosyltransferase family 9 protein [Vibrio sp. SCSIO 43136]